MRATEPKPRKSNKFDSPSLYYKGVYYFPDEIKESNKVYGKPYEIQVVYHDGKWRQDTMYITSELRDLLLNSI